MVEHRDLVMKNVRIALVETEALLEGRLIVEVQRQPGMVESARTVEGTATGSSKRHQTRMAQSGTILIREWQGTAHRVTMLDDGVSFNGKRYRSLSEVAREITGSRWSGPRFFGLRSQVTENNHAAG